MPATWVGVGRAELLHGLERALLISGIGVVAWCAAVLVEARYIRDLPVPTAQVETARLPGERDQAGRSRAIRAETGSWVGRLVAPTVKMSVTVLEGSDEATLSRGAGHIPDTAFPGDRGNVGIAGHRDTAFRPVRNLRLGDPIELVTSTHIHRYRVSNTIVVNPEDVYVLDPSDHPMLTLVTCYPFTFVGHAPQRFIVQAELVSQRRRAAPPVR